jgi:hypothetical protein
MTMTASSAPAMQGNTQGDFIADFSTTTSPMSIPSYDFSVAEVPDSPGHAFGYTVKASTTADLHQRFLSTGGVCNQGGGSQEADQCWIGASTTAYTIVNRSTATPASGATTTLQFRVILDPDATDTTAEDTYTATTTLTATNN